MKRVLLLFVVLINSIALFAQSPFIKHDYPRVATPAMGNRIDFGDMDADGDEDLINWANTSSSGPIRIYKSSGTAIDSLDYVEFYSSNTTLITDWDQDDLPDFVDIYTYSGGINLIKNQGAMTFGTMQTIGTTANYYYDTCRIDSDIYPDLVSWTGNSIQLHQNLNGTDAVTTYPVNSTTSLPQSSSICFNDIENDGLMEMFVRNVSNKIYIYSHSGDFNYALSDSIVSTTIGSTISNSMFFKDMNNDGFNEIIYRNGWNIYIMDHVSGFDYVQVYVGNASYTVNTGFGFAALSNISDLYDVDGNGFLDIVAGNSVFFNNGSFAFNEVQINQTPRLYTSYYKCTDYDGDGNTDICYVYIVSNTHFEEVFYRSENTVGQTIDYQQSIWLLWGREGHVTDFDNDGDMDVSGYVYGKAVIWENEDDTLFPRYGGQAYDYYTEFIDMVDINADGYEDVVTSTATETTDEHWYRYNQSGNQLSNLNFISASNMHLKLIEDIDGDGIPELFYHRLSGTTNNYIYMYKVNTGLPVLAGTIMTWTDYGVEDVVVRLSDYDSDGLKDLVVQHEASAWDKIRMVKNNGNNTFTQGQVVSCGCVELLDVFDSNGDNTPDLHWHNGDNRIYRNLNSNGAFLGGTILNTLSAGTFSSTQGKKIDLNNDEIMDLVVQSNSKQLLFSNQGNGLTLLNNEPATKRLSRVADLDGDGDMDIVTEGIWYENTLVSPFRTVGTVYYDVNENGAYESGNDILFPLFPIQLSNGSLISYTNNDGHFDIPVGSNPGSFNISMADQMLTDFEATTIPYPSLANVDELNPMDSVSIGVKNLTSLVNGEFDVTLSGHRCNEPGRLYLNFRNVSPVSVDAIVKVALAENTTFIGSNEAAVLNVDTLTWTFGSVEPFENVMFYADLNMPGTASMGDTMIFVSSTELTGVLGSMTLPDTIKQILTCAYDPNDKQITMLNHVYLGDSIFSFSDETEYTIRFQNTGNDTAQTVVIRDNLSSLFDWTTLRPISASDSYNFTIDSVGIIEVTFNNINLPDSSTNFLESMGFVKFAVEYADNSPTFVPVLNQARIYFDLNPPIFTNTHKFFRVNCIDFINISTQYTSQCYNDSLYVANNAFDLPFDYLWTIGSEQFVTEESAYLPMNTSGLVNYTLQLSNEHCTADSTLSINVLPLPDIQLNMGDSSVCEGYDLYVYANQNVTWANSLTSSTSFSDDYYVSMYESLVLQAYTTGTNGCSDTVTINLDLNPRPDFIHEMDLDPYGYNSIYLCAPEDVVLNANYGPMEWYVYFYSGEPEIWETSESITIPVTAGETGFQVDSYSEIEGCFYFTSVYYTIDPTAEITLFGNVISEETNVTCDLDSIPVYTDHQVDWYLDGEFIQNSTWINANSNGTYTAEDECGHSLWFTMNNGVSQSTNETVAVCTGTSYIFPDGTQVANINSTMSHESILNSVVTGCDSIVTTIIEIENNVNFTTEQNGAMLSVNSVGSSFQWLNCDDDYSEISGANLSTFLATENGSYAVLITNNGCIDTSSCMEVSGLSIDDLLSDKGILYYPNPTIDYLNIDLSALNGTIVLTLNDLQGRTLRKIEATGLIKMDLRNLPSGIYTVTANGSGLQKTMRIIKVTE